MANKHTFPIAKPRPDWQWLLRVLDGEVRPERPPIFEYIADAEIMRLVVEGMLGRAWVTPLPGDRAAMAAYLDNYIAFWYHMGYDTVRYDIALGFPGRAVATANTAALATRDRHWSDQHTRLIQSWDDYERFPWPDPSRADYFPLEYLSRHLPEGMGLMVEHSCHVMELLVDAFTYEGLSLAIYDQPDLVAAVAGRITAALAGFFRQVVDMDNVVAFCTGDDMGFRSGTFLSPADMRRYVLPSHTEISAIAHAHGKRRYLHACGNLDAIMTDLIETVSIDGKHSFEDAIQPVEEFHRLYGNRIASLGGVDVDLLARGTEEEVRARTRQVIAACAPLGRFAIGSGNSITNYVALENYLAMVEEALFA